MAPGERHTPGTIRFYLASYLGKGEPSERMFRGKLVPNTRKLVRGLTFGGRERSGRYDAPQGQIRGATALKKGVDIARELKKAMQTRQSGDLSDLEVESEEKGIQKREGRSVVLSAPLRVRCSRSSDSSEYGLDLPGFCGERLAHVFGLSLEGGWAFPAQC